MAFNDTWHSVLGFEQQQRTLFRERIKYFLMCFFYISGSNTFSRKHFDLVFGNDKPAGLLLFLNFLLIETETAYLRFK